VAVAFLSSPFLVGPAYASIGTRGVAGFGLACALAAAAWRAVRGGVGGLGFGVPQYLGLAALSAAGVATGSRTWLMLLPAVVYLFLLWIFARTLREPVSLIGRLARFVDPKAPDFIDPYCRKLTVIWCTAFAANAVAIAALALAGRQTEWALYTGIWSYVGMGALQTVEFFVRKLWFRNYTSRPLDRLLSRLFPAENTAQGRRSLAYIQEMRRRIARGEQVGVRPSSPFGSPR
jgi:uncharacterized membrane protein